jgi:hypothetical protein
LATERLSCESIMRTMRGSKRKGEGETSKTCRLLVRSICPSFDKQFRHQPRPVVHRFGAHACKSVQSYCNEYFLSGLQNIWIVFRSERSPHLCPSDLPTNQSGNDMRNEPMLMEIEHICYHEQHQECKKEEQE